MKRVQPGDGDSGPVTREATNPLTRSKKCVMKNLIENNQWLIHRSTYRIIQHKASGEKP